MRPDAGKSSPQVAEFEAYHAAFHSADAATAIVDVTPPGRLIDATDRFLFLTSTERAESIGKTFDEIFSKEGAKHLLTAAMQAKGLKGPTTDTIHAFAEQNASRITVRAKPLTGNLVALTLDVGGAPGRTLRRPPLLNELGELSGGMIYIYDVARRRARHLTRNLFDIIGIDPSDPVGAEQVLSLIHPDDTPSYMRAVEEFAHIADGEVRQFWFRVLRPKDNSWRWIHNNATVYARDPAGNVRHVIGLAFDVTLPRKAFDELAVAANALLHAEESERLRIARELHDSTAQHLVASDLLIAAHLQKHGTDESLSCVRDTLATALREIRTLSFLLHPPRLRDEGLNKTLRTFAEGFASRSGLAANLDIRPHPRLAPAIETVLFRVCQEAFMNAHRHANATRVNLRLDWNGREIILEVEDDGVGVGDLNSIRPGVGIDGMRARLTSLGGEMSIEDTGKGTLLRASVPAAGYFHELSAPESKSSITTLHGQYV